MGRPQYPPPPLLDPGWYRDPTARFEARYWDGRDWTSHISHYGATGSDPLLAARFDVPWVRWSLRVIGLVVLAGVGWWAFGRWWPRDDRDLTADAGVLAAAALVRADLPAGYTPSTHPPISPLTDPVVEPGLDDVAGPVDAGADDPTPCEELDPAVDDARDEPRLARAFVTDAGDAVVNEMAITADAEDAARYLGALRAEEAGACLADLWAASLVSSGSAASVDAATVRAMVDPAFGDAALWWRMDATVPGAVPVRVFADVIVVQVDRVVSQYSFEGVGTAIGVAVHRDLISPHTTRVRETLARLDDADAETAHAG